MADAAQGRIDRVIQLQAIHLKTSRPARRG
jgi:hypothetical protein